MPQSKIPLHLLFRSPPRLLHASLNPPTHLPRKPASARHSHHCFSTYLPNKQQRNNDRPPNFRKTAERVIFHLQSELGCDAIRAAFTDRRSRQQQRSNAGHARAQSEKFRRACEGCQCRQGGCWSAHGLWQERSVLGRPSPFRHHHLRQHPKQQQDNLAAVEAFGRGSLEPSSARAVEQQRGDR
eukprot:1060197-Rhodomonas_salina.1